MVSAFAVVLVCGASEDVVATDARSWRFRCRVMSAISLFTYIPFIVLVAVFVPRN